MPSHIVHPSDVERRIHELEVTEHELSNALLAEAGPQAAHDDRLRELVTESYRIAGSLCQAWSTFNGLLHWRDVRRQYLEPRLEAAQMLAEKSSRMTDYLAYIRDLVRVLDDLDVLYARDENASLEELRISLSRVFELDSETPLQHIALHSLRCTAGVNTVLVGMRQTAYVDDVMYSNDMAPSTYDRKRWLLVADELQRLSEEPS